MGSEEFGDRVFQQRNCSSILNCPSSVMATDSIADNVAAGMPICSESMLKSPISGVDPFYTSGWDPMNYLGNSSMAPQNESANDPHYPIVLENQTTASHLVHFTPDSGLVDMVPKIPNFVSGNFSEMVSSFGHNMDVPQNHGGGIANTQDSQGNCQHSEDGVLGASPIGKRKRKVPVGVSSKTVEVEHQRDQIGDTSEFRKHDEKKTVAANSRGKQAVKQVKDNSNGAEISQEDYILVRAKRGQATNSHSLAERVRREKISERMRLLQELVPGCNKIAGKAVMLDEIINYVQSLQQQVEFLSMKLAAVNPELSVDIDRILPKDLLNPQSRNTTGLGMGPSHLFHGLHHGNLNGLQITAPPFHLLPPNLWNNELQSMLQMGFDSNNSNWENGLSKMEL